jgi:hypothetical protein
MIINVLTKYSMFCLIHISGSNLRHVGKTGTYFVLCFLLY